MAGEPPKPPSWWQTLPGILTAVAGIITAATGLIVALNQAGALSSKEKTVSPTPAPTATLAAATPDKTRTDVITDVNELERKLGAANIKLSTGTVADRERVIGYITSSNPAYRLLANGCIQL